MDWIPNVNNPQWTVTDKQRTPMYNDDNGAMQTKNNASTWNNMSEQSYNKLDLLFTLKTINCY